MWVTYRLLHHLNVRLNLTLWRWNLTFPTLITMSVANSAATYLTKIWWYMLILNEINKSRRNKKSQEKSIERINKNMACKLLYLRFSCMHNGKIIKSLFYWYYWNNNMHGFPLSIKYGESIEPTDNQILPLNASSIY